MSEAPIGLGVCGLGRGFMLMLPTFRRDPRVKLVAAFTPGADARDRFAREFGGNAHDTLDGMLADPAVEAVYIASPHEVHAEQAIAASRAGKHILVDKPLCVRMDEGAAMVAAARDAGVHLIVGPAHSFDGPVQRARAIIDSGRVGRVRMIHALNYTDFLYRPRRPSELVTAEGGGVIFSQGAHQIDIVRLLAGRMARGVTARTGSWDPERPTEGAYAALIDFEGGVFASLTYSGYAHFDSDEFCDWIGELGRARDPEVYGTARRALLDVPTPEEEAALKRTRTYAGGGEDPSPPIAHEHFGPILVSCDGADLRIGPRGVTVYGDTTRAIEALPAPEIPRREVIDALVDAVRHDRPPVQTGAWGLATLEVCHAIITSAREQRTVVLTRQVAI